MPTRFLKRIFYPLKTSIMISLLFAVACFLFFGMSPFSKTIDYILHAIFFIIIFADFALSFYFNKTSSFFFSLVMLVAYLLINNIKGNYGFYYWANPAYCYISALLPLTLCALTFSKSNSSLFTKKNLAVLLILLLEYSICENLAMREINIFYSSSVFGLNLFSFFSFVVCLLICFVKKCMNGTARDNSYFFAFLAIFFAFFFSLQASANCLFFALAAILTFSGSAYKIYYESYYDTDTGVFNQSSYVLHAEKFPLKYCICISRIDNYAHLAQALGEKNTSRLLKTIVALIAQNGDVDGIYRVAEDMFVFVFYNKDKNAGFEAVEEIRRRIATAEFITARSVKPIKLTITSATAEKRRSDFDSLSVITRALNKLKTSLSENITLKA